MKKRQSAIRKTVSCDDDEENTTLIFGKNTDRQMYANNPLYRKLCIYCDKHFPKNLLQHYVKDHSEHEVPIARPSPEMANRLRLQHESFEHVNGKIQADCLFCEEIKTMPRWGWQSHLLTHSGEKMFDCKQCHLDLKTRSEHNNMDCKNSVVNVFQTKADGALVCFMCNDCNYFQFSRDRLLNHLRNEHGYEQPLEPNHLKELILVKGFKTSSTK